MYKRAEIFLHHTSNDSPNPYIYIDRFNDRWTSDVRRTTDLNKWTGNSRPYIIYADHVLEQSFEEQELWYGRCIICITVYR